MTTCEVLVVRIYISESSHLMKQVVDYLKKETKVRGMSVFRAISGFGESGNHSAQLIDLSLDLPLCIEFFDTPEVIHPVLEHLTTVIKPEHIVFWEAKANT